MSNTATLNSNHLDDCPCFDCNRKSKPWDDAEWVTTWRTFKKMCRNCGKDAGLHHSNFGGTWAARCPSSTFTKLSSVASDINKRWAKASWYEPNH